MQLVVSHPEALTESLMMIWHSHNAGSGKVHNHYSVLYDVPRSDLDPNK